MSTRFVGSLAGAVRGIVNAQGGHRARHIVFTGFVESTEPPAGRVGGQIHTSPHQQEHGSHTDHFPERAGRHSPEP
ncbi:MAG: hypothetical protein AB7P22_08125 [Vicinamibacterales bacterium]